MENILIIGAHYDDAELGCGGTAAKLAAEGKNVYKLTLTDNVTNFSQMQINVDYESSVRESALACEALGIKEITEYKPDRCCQLFYNTETMQRIEEVIFKYKIDTVFIHYSDDLNQDHIESSKLCVTAARHCDNVLFYKSNLYIVQNTYSPNFFVDISDYIDKKKNALAQYTGDHNRFNSLFETNIDQNRVWGYSNKVKYAEGFVIHKFLVR